MQRLQLSSRGKWRFWYQFHLLAVLPPHAFVHGISLCSLHFPVVREEEACPKVCVAAEPGLEPRSPDYVH